MGIKKTLLGFYIFGLAVAGQSAQTANLASRSIDDISACMRVNVFDRGAVRDFQIKMTSSEGRSKSLKFKVFWKPSKSDDKVRITLQMIKPKSLAGTAYLLTQDSDEEQLYMYLPSLRKVRRLVGGENSENLWDSDLSFADIKQLQGLLLEGEVQRGADQRIAGRPVYLLETATSVEQTGYSLVRSYVDQESCMLLKAELFTGDEKPRKILDADVSTLMEIDPMWVILGYRVTDKGTGTHTEINLSNVFIQQRLPNSLFTPEGFYIDRE